MPVTFAPSSLSHNASQHPLNPVCPVNKTLFVFPKSLLTFELGIIPILSMVLLLYSKALQVFGGLSMCPLVARNLRANMHSTVFLLLTH